MWELLWKFLLAGLSTLGTGIAIIEFVFDVTGLEEFLNKFNISTHYIKNHWIVFVIIFLGIVFAFTLSDYLKKSKKLKETAEKFHKIQHHIRNEAFDMRRKNGATTFSSNVEDFYGNVQNICTGLCEKIHSFIKHKTNKDCSICIKLIKTSKHRNSSNNKADELYTFTLCRVGKDTDKRKDNAIDQFGEFENEQDILVPVSGNTAFSEILKNSYNKNTPTIFACSNLLMYSNIRKIFRRSPYLNPNKNFLKHYKSTIVVPIRINNKYLPETSRQEKYKIIGFLCLDYKRPMSGKLKNELSGYLKGFADSLFSLFYEIKKHDKKIESHI